VGDYVQEHTANQRTNPSRSRSQSCGRHGERPQYTHDAGQRQRSGPKERGAQPVFTAVGQRDDRYQGHGMRDQCEDDIEMLGDSSRQRRVRADAEPVTHVMQEQADEPSLERDSSRR